MGAGKPARPGAARSAGIETASPPAARTSATVGGRKGALPIWESMDAGALEVEARAARASRRYAVRRRAESVTRGQTSFAISSMERRASAGSAQS